MSRVEREDSAFGELEREPLDDLLARWDRPGQDLLALAVELEVQHAIGRLGAEVLDHSEDVIGAERSVLACRETEDADVLGDLAHGEQVLRGSALDRVRHFASCAVAEEEHEGVLSVGGDRSREIESTVHVERAERRTNTLERSLEAQPIAREGSENVDAIRDRREEHLVLPATTLHELARALQHSLDPLAPVRLASVHARGDVEEEHDALLLDGAELQPGLRDREDERRQDQELQQERVVALETAEQRAGAGLDDEVGPQPQVRHVDAPALDLQDVENDHGQREQPEQQGERTREAHPTSPPRRKTCNTSSS